MKKIELTRKQANYLYDVGCTIGFTCTVSNVAWESDRVRRKNESFESFDLFIRSEALGPVTYYHNAYFDVMPRLKEAGLMDGYRVDVYDVADLLWSQCESIEIEPADGYVSYILRYRASGREWTLNGGRHILSRTEWQELKVRTDDMDGWDMGGWDMDRLYDMHFWPFRLSVVSLVGQIQEYFS